MNVSNRIGCLEYDLDFRIYGDFHESGFNHMLQSQILWMWRHCRLFTRIFWNWIWDRARFSSWSWSKRQILGTAGCRLFMRIEGRFNQSCLWLDCAAWFSELFCLCNFFWKIIRNFTWRSVFFLCFWSVVDVKWEKIKHVWVPGGRRNSRLSIVFVSTCLWSFVY